MSERKAGPPPQPVRRPWTMQRQGMTRKAAFAAVTRYGFSTLEFANDLGMRPSYTPEEVRQWITFARFTKEGRTG